ARMSESSQTACASGLEIVLHPGSVRTTMNADCPQPDGKRDIKQIPFGFDAEILTFPLVQAGHAVEDDDPDVSAPAIRFAKGWEFPSLNPFRAHLAPPEATASVGGL